MAGYVRHHFGLNRRLECAAIRSGIIFSSASRICTAPKFDVITTTLRKSTVLPWPSVNRPSSSTCSRILKTSDAPFQPHPIEGVSRVCDAPPVRYPPS